MNDLGVPASYLTLEPRAAVLFSDGEQLGKVRRVLAEPDADIFEGIEVDLGLLAKRRFVAAELVDEIYENGVMLTIDSSQGESLPEAGG